MTRSFKPPPSLGALRNHVGGESWNRPSKPSEETPSSAVPIAEAFCETTVPPGVFNVVQGCGPGSAGAGGLCS